MRTCTDLMGSDCSLVNYTIHSMLSEPSSVHASDIFSSFIALPSNTLAYLLPRFPKPNLTRVLPDVTIAQGYRVSFTVRVRSKRKKNHARCCRRQKRYHRAPNCPKEQRIPKQQGRQAADEPQKHNRKETSSIPLRHRLRGSRAQKPIHPSNHQRDIIPPPQTPPPTPSRTRPPPPARPSPPTPPSPRSARSSNAPPSRTGPRPWSASRVGTAAWGTR